MREIKFRAWDGSRMWDKTEIAVGNNDLFEILNDHNAVELFSEAFELMQYTGLKDKNGKEIYEGDIVRHLYTDWASKEEDDKNYRLLIEAFKGIDLEFDPSMLVYDKPPKKKVKPIIRVVDLKGELKSKRNKNSLF